MKRVGLISLACMVAAAMCVFALADLPYGYYTLLRLVVCATSISVGLQLVMTGRVRWSLLAWGVALLYNPLVRVGLERDVWAMVNLGTAATLMVGAWMMRRPKASEAAPIEASVNAGAVRADDVDELDDDDAEDEAPGPNRHAPSPTVAPVEDQYSGIIREATARLRARGEARAAEEAAEARADALRRQSAALQAKIDAIGKTKRGSP
ncbi:MAG: hypothetical protein IT432_11600 [Phycisphaerales bacterium]|nr:hypothetical protein [Phycisphaerales bacterium]